MKLVFDLLIALIVKSAILDLTPSSVNKSSLVNLYKSVTFLINPLESKLSIIDSPTPRIFIASFSTNRTIERNCFALHAELGHTQATSVSPFLFVSLCITVSQCLQLVGRLYPTKPLLATFTENLPPRLEFNASYSSFVRLVSTHLTISGMISPAFRITTLQPLDRPRYSTISQLCNDTRLTLVSANSIS